MQEKLTFLSLSIFRSRTTEGTTLHDTRSPVLQVFQEHTVMPQFNVKDMWAVTTCCKLHEEMGPGPCGWSRTHVNRGAGEGLLIQAHPHDVNRFVLTFLFDRCADDLRLAAQPSGRIGRVQHSLREGGWEAKSGIFRAFSEIHTSILEYSRSWDIRCNLKG